MPQAADPSTGQVVDLAPDELVSQWKTGAVHLLGGQSYHVVTPEGRYFAVPAEELAGAIDKGAKLTTAEDAAAHKRTAEYGGAKGAGIAFGGGVLEQGTLGLGERLLPESAKHAISEASEEQPIAKMAGQGLGFAGLSAVLPGGGVAGLAERGVARAAGTVAAEGIAKRAIVAGAKAAAEGAQFGAGQAIGDSAIHDAPLTAAHVLASIGGNALWGAGLGGGLSLLGAAVPKALRRAEELPTAAGPLERALDGAPHVPPADEQAVETAAGKVLGTTPAEGLGATVRKWYAKAASVASGKDADAIENVVSRRAELLDMEETRAAASRALREHGDAILTANKAITEEAQGKLKRDYIARAVGEVEPQAAARASVDMVGDTLQTLKKMADSPEDFGGSAPIKRAQTIADRVARKLNGAIQRDDVAEQFALVDDLKKAIGKYTKGASRLSPASATDELIALQNKARAEQLQGLYERLRTGLEDESVWKQAAKDQQAINGAWTKQIDASDRFHRALTTEVGRDPNNPWLTARGIDPAKVDGYVRGLTNPAQDLTHKAVTDYVGSTRELAETIGEAYDLPKAKLAQVGKLRDAAQAFEQTISDQTGKLTLANQFAELSKKSEGGGLAFAAAALGLGGEGGEGGLGFGLKVLGLGKFAAIFTHPAEAIMQLARIEQMTRDNGARISRAFRGFSRGGGPRPSPVRLSDYARRADEVRRSATDAATTAQRMDQTLAPIRARSPKLAQAMRAGSLGTLAFLQSKLPPQPPADPLEPERAAPMPHPGAQEAFLRYYRAVRDPLSVVEDLRHGKLSPEGVEVLKSVPAMQPLYAEVQKGALDAMAAGKLRDLSQQQRLGMGMLLDLPLPELSPGYVASRQSAYAMPPPPTSSAPTGKPRGGGKLQNLMPPPLAGERVEAQTGSR